MASSVDLQEFVIGFVIEAEEYLDSVNRNLVAVSEALKQNRSEPRAVRELFRALHTIKGLASMVGADPIVEISHEMESILRTAERAGGQLSEKTLDLLMQGTRALEERVKATSANGIAGIPKAPQPLLEALTFSQGLVPPPRKAENIEFALPEFIQKSLSLAEFEQVTQAFVSDRRIVLIEFQPSPEMAALGFNITSVRERVGRIGNIVKVLPRSAPGAPTGISFALLLETLSDDDALTEASGVSSEHVLEIVATKGAELEPEIIPGTPSLPDFNEEWAPTEQSSVRVDIRRLDETLERLSELVVTRSKLACAVADLTARGVDTREINAVLVDNTRQLKRLRAAITKARMVPLGELLQRLPLVVRGMTKDTDKSVNLNLQVGLSEVDKAVADKIFPAIVHLIRNSVDHGIETMTERRAQGKPETATISILSDDSSGTNLILKISDDGRGIDREAVSRKSMRAVAQTDEELLEQITMPGLSTQDDVSLTSGRGMGMDIVLRSIEMLSGQLILETHAQRGTTFTLHVPVSITIVDILTFVSAGQTFAVPVAMVQEILEVDAKDIIAAPNPLSSKNQSSLIQRRGEAIPFLSLDSVLYRRQATASPKALVVKQHKGGAIAFGVDRMLGQLEAVVRPFDDVLVRGQGMAGATDLGDGLPTIVLDLAAMGITMKPRSLETV